MTQPMGEPTRMPPDLLAGCPVGTKVQLAVVVRLFRAPDGHEGIHVQYEVEQPEQSIRNLARGIEAIFQSETARRARAEQAIEIPSPDVAKKLLEG